IKMTDEQWSAAYAASENIWLDSNASASDKQNAWRTQNVLLAHATRNLSESLHYDILQEHQEKLQKSSSTELYLKERLAGCQQLLSQSRRARPSNKMPLDWSQLPLSSSTFLPCHGTYESCKHDEITVDDLQRWPTATNSTNGNNNISYINNNSSINITSLNNNSEKLIQVEKSPSRTAVTFDGFRTAREQLMLHDAQKNKQNPGEKNVAAGCDLMNYSKKKSLGGRGRGVYAKFVLPTGQSENATTSVASAETTVNPNGTVLPSLAHLDALMVEQITRESMHKYKTIAWSDVAGLEYAKSTFMETIIHPLQRPDLFKGVRRPPRGVLLFGPPGTGKTLIAKCIASQSRATFFSINPSSLTSKWVGEGEKLVKTLFAVAAAHQPAIIFMDEVDSLLSQRSDNEHESSRRLKNEFFIQLDGAATNEDDNIMIIGATNRPQELDEAVRRRFVRRLYVPLPVTQARQQIITNLLKQVQHSLSDEQIEGLAELTEGYSGADMDSLCRYAAMQPLRSLSSSQIDTIDAQQLPAVSMSDFMCALQHVSKSVSPEDIKRYVSWNEIYGIKY
ncbi:hypothetical protein KR044_002837, partial [Drosophila immigrans]